MVEKMAEANNDVSAIHAGPYSATTRGSRESVTDESAHDKRSKIGKSVSSTVIIELFTAEGNVFKLEVKKPSVTAEELLISAAKHEMCNVGPLEKNLFQLYQPQVEGKGAWIHPGHVIYSSDDAPAIVLQLRFCFMVPNLKEHSFRFDSTSKVLDFRKLSPQVVNYLFSQCRYDLLHGHIDAVSLGKVTQDELQKTSFGFALMDLLGVMRNENIPTVKQLLKKHNIFDVLPRHVVSELGFLRKYGLKRKLEQKLEEVNKLTENQPQSYFREHCIRYLLSGDSHMDYLQEIFYVQEHHVVEASHGTLGTQNRGGTFSQAQSPLPAIEYDFLPAIVQISPFHPKQPGIRIRLCNSKNWRQVCEIEELITLTLKVISKDDDSIGVEVGHSQGCPTLLKFSSFAIAESFVTIVDGYYRLTKNFIHNLCSQLITPSLRDSALKGVHGPVSVKFATHKLKEKSHGKAGFYLLRQSPAEYDKFFLERLTENGPESPLRFDIERLQDGSVALEYRQDGLKFLDIRTLVEFYMDQAKQKLMPDLFIHPSDYDDSDVLLCKKHKESTPASQCCRDGGSDDPALIKYNDIIFSRSRDAVAEGRFSIVNKDSRWRIADGQAIPVAVKHLKQEHISLQLSQEFQSGCDRFLYTHDAQLVHVFGVCLHPLMLVMEPLMLGSLDKYLRGNKEKLLHYPNDQLLLQLFEACGCIAKALNYLDMLKIVHGNIRLNNVMVVEGQGPFRVKLADPGLPSAYRNRVHWIALENQQNPLSLKAEDDIWACATTFWEIFSFAQEPEPTDRSEAIRFYRTQNRLPEPDFSNHTEIYENVLLKCWNANPAERLGPMKILRSIHERVVMLSESLPAGRNPSIIPTLMEQSTLQLRTVNGEAGKMGVSYLPMRTGMTENSIDELLENIKHIPKVDLSGKKKIGQGAFGDVYYYMWNDGTNEHQEVAVKYLIKGRTSPDELKDEVKVMSKLQHPNVLQFEGVILDGGHIIAIVTEYARQGSLDGYLKRHKANGGLGIKYKVAFSHCIAKGMEYLSSRNVVHRDLSARNVLVFTDTCVKISDFGLSRFSESSKDYYRFLHKERKLPIYWYAPEVFKDLKHGVKADVFSYGITLWEIYSNGQFPKLASSPEEHQKKMESGDRLAKPNNCPDRIYKTMLRCWNAFPEERPSFSDLTSETFDWQKDKGIFP